MDQAGWLLIKLTTTFQAGVAPKLKLETCKGLLVQHRDWQTIQSLGHKAEVLSTVRGVEGNGPDLTLPVQCTRDKAKIVWLMR